MTTFLRTVWDNVLAPILQRPKRLQIAALCHRGSGADKEVLLVTSRGTGRWIIPKGWPIRGLKSNEAALQEAWEEAGVRNSVANSEPVGTYSYDKVLDTGYSVPVEALVYSVEVEDLSEKFPESDQRTRKWMRPEEAANLVNESQLKTLLRQF